MEEATELKPPQAAKEGGFLGQALVCPPKRRTPCQGQGNNHKSDQARRRQPCLVLARDCDIPASGRSPPCGPSKVSSSEGM